MEDKNKHNIFSKEEFFRHIDEKKSLPPDADDFDKEAMEGLAMVKDRKKLERLDAAIDDIVHREATRAGRKKNIYYFSAAASLALIIGIFFLVKETTLKKETNLAQKAPEKTEEVVIGKDREDAQKVIGGEDKKMPATEAPQMKPKEEAFKEGKLAEAETKERALGNAVTTVNVPAESQNQVATNEKAPDYGWSNGAGVAASGKAQDNKGGGKSTLDETAVADQELSRGVKDELAQKAEEKKAPSKKTAELSKNMEEERKVYKEVDEKEKRRYESNTVWTSTPSPNGPGALKQQQSQTDSKPQVAANDRSVAETTATTSAAPVQTQTEAIDLSKADKNNNNATRTGEDQAKSSEIAVTSKSRDNSGAKHSRSRKSKSKYASAPAREQNADKDVAGYSYYSQTSTRDFTSPEFIGGTAALQQFVGDNLEVSAPEKKGTVGVEFTVKPDGSVDTSNIKITLPIKDCNPCSKDVKDLVKKMPKWQPALENGKGKEYRQKMSVPYKASRVKK